MTTDSCDNICCECGKLGATEYEEEVWFHKKCLEIRNEYRRMMWLEFNICNLITSLRDCCYDLQVIKCMLNGDLEIDDI
jgi:hypothetical protein